VANVLPRPIWNSMREMDTDLLDSWCTGFMVHVGQQKSRTLLASKCDANVAEVSESTCTLRRAETAE